VSWRLICKPIVPSSNTGDWWYERTGRWGPVQKTLRNWMAYATKGEALFALHQVRENDEDMFSYSVEEIW